MHELILGMSRWVATQAPAEGGAPPDTGAFNIILIVLMFAAVYFIMIRPQAKQQREHQSFLTTLQKGTEVVTSGGVLGKVHSVSGDTVTVEVAKDVRIQVLKTYVFPHRPAAAAPAAAQKEDGKDGKDSSKGGAEAKK
ncbi:MAG: preprotein translocase subunit YajC [Myxococcota bacterium]